MLPMIKAGWSKDAAGYSKSLWVRYRLTGEGYKKLWEKQDGKCAGCGIMLAHPFDETMGEGVKPLPDWDEDGPGESRGFTRGFLCQDCKTEVRHLEKDVKAAETRVGVLGKLIEYLKENGL